MSFLFLCSVIIFTKTASQQGISNRLLQPRYDPFDQTKFWSAAKFSLKIDLYSINEFVNEKSDEE